MAKDKTEKYADELYLLQVELVKLQRRLIAEGARVLIILEGRDAAGKDGTIKRLIEHMSPRDTRIFAPTKPSEREESEWYFQRFVPHLPAGGEFVVFNRSWYNRAGVERVMGFCTPKQVKQFFSTVGDFESLLVRSGMELRKYYLDVSRKEQKKRLTDREDDPLKCWKNSPIDASAEDKFDDYTKARDDMFKHTSHKDAPWRIVLSDHKHAARLALIADLLDSFDYRGKNKKLNPDRDVVFDWQREREDRLAR